MSASVLKQPPSRPPEEAARSPHTRSGDAMEGRWAQAPRSDTGRHGEQTQRSTSKWGPRAQSLTCPHQEISMSPGPGNFCEGPTLSSLRYQNKNIPKWRPRAREHAVGLQTEREVCQAPQSLTLHKELRTPCRTSDPRSSSGSRRRVGKVGLTRPAPCALASWASAHRLFNLKGKYSPGWLCGRAACAPGLTFCTCRPGTLDNLIFEKILFLSLMGQRSVREAGETQRR